MGSLPPRRAYFKVRTQQLSDECADDEPPFYEDHLFGNLEPVLAGDQCRGNAMVARFPAGLLNLRLE